MWIIFIILIEFVTILFPSYVLFSVFFLLFVWFFWPQGMWYLSSQTSDPTGTLCIGRQSPNHWTTREVPVGFLYKILHRSHKKRNEKERKGGVTD